MELSLVLDCPDPAALERFAQLCADVRELDHGHRHQTGEHQIHDEIAHRHCPRANRGAADQDHDDADRAEDEGGERRNARHARQRPRDVAEEPMRALRKDQLLAFLGGVRLDDTDAAQ